MFCKKCGKLKLDINRSCGIGQIQRHTQHIVTDGGNTISPYIGVDGRRFNNLLEKWKDFLKSKCKAGYTVRYARKYDGFLVRGVYHDSTTIRFYQREGEKYFDITLSKPHEIQPKFMIYAEAIYKGAEEMCNKTKFDSVNSLIGKICSEKTTEQQKANLKQNLELMLIWAGDNTKQCKETELDRLCSDSNGKLRAISWTQFGPWYVNDLLDIQNQARNYIAAGGEGMVVQLLTPERLLFQNRMYVLKFKSITETVAMRFNIYDIKDQELGYVLWREDERISVQLRHLTLGVVGKGNVVCGYLNKWGAGANDTVRFYVGIGSSKEIHINIKTIFKNFIFTANSTTLRTYKITETPSDVMHKQKCSEIYRTGEARCAYCNEENNYGLFEITDTSTQKKILVCAFQVMNHILEHSCIMIPHAHNAFRQKLNINGTTGKIAEKQSELEKFLILYSEPTVPKHRAGPAVKDKNSGQFQNLNFVTHDGTDVGTGANETPDAQDVNLVAGTNKRRNPDETNPGTVPTSSKKQHNTGGPATASLSTQVSCVPFRRANAFCALHCSGCNKIIQPTDTYTIDKSKNVYCEDCGDSVELLMESTFQRIAQKQQEKLSNSGEEVAKCGLDACERDVVLSGIHVRAANVLYHVTCFASRE